MAVRLLHTSVVEEGVVIGAAIAIQARGRRVRGEYTYFIVRGWKCGFVRRRMNKNEKGYTFEDEIRGDRGREMVDVICVYFEDLDAPLCYLLFHDPAT